MRRSRARQDKFKSSEEPPIINEAGECRGHCEGAKDGKRDRGSCSRLVTRHSSLITVFVSIGS
jgi:hypothetical protein